MPTLALKIIDDKNYYDVGKYPIEYSLILVHSLWYYYIENKKSVDLNKALKKAKDYVDKIQRINKDYLRKGESGPETFICENHFLELYKIDCKNGLGIVVVDRSKGIYPLMLYPNDTSSSHGDRQNAFNISFVCVMNQVEVLKSKYFDKYSIESWFNHVDEIKTLLETKGPKLEVTSK